MLTHGKLCLWPHSNGRWKTLAILFLISGGIQTVCTSHTRSDKRSKDKLQGTSLLLNIFFLSFSFLNTSYLLLPSSILDCLIPDGRQWSQDTKHKARRRRFIACWESEQKKVSLSGKGIMFFNYLAIWLLHVVFQAGLPHQLLLKRALTWSPTLNLAATSEWHTITGTMLRFLLCLFIF